MLRRSLPELSAGVTLMLRRSLPELGAGVTLISRWSDQCDRKDSTLTRAAPIANNTARAILARGISTWD